MFHNFVICASPFPPVFGLFFALPPFWAAAAGLPFGCLLDMGKDTASRPFESSPMPNAGQKGEKLKGLQFPPVFGLFFALPPFLAAAAVLRWPGQTVPSPAANTRFPRGPLSSADHCGPAFIPSGFII